MDRHTKDQRSKNMRAIKSSGSQIEIMLARALWKLGYRYRKNDTTVFGKPDFTLKKYRLAIFVDGEFWHGKDWKKRKPLLINNKEYWIKKIERNIQRDKEVKSKLLKEGWKIIRFWGEEIKKDVHHCISKIELKINDPM